MKRWVIIALVLLVLISGCVQKTEEITKPAEAVKEELPQQPETPPTEEVQEQKQEPVKAPEEIKELENILEPQTNWPTFHGNLARTGFSTSKAPSKPNVLWKWTIDDFEKAGIDMTFDENWPIIVNNKVFFGIEEIIAFDLKTGKKIWSFADENFYARGFAAGNGKIFATANNNDNLDAISAGFIYALDEKTGKFLWRYQTEEGIPFSLPLFADNKVFVGDNSGNVYAVDADSGNLIWKKYLDGAKVIHSSPAFDNGVIFIGTEASIGPKSTPSYLYALDAKNGEIIWKFVIDVVPGKLNLIHASPSISNNIVYFGVENGYFYALSSKDGKLIWKQVIASGSGELIGVSASAALGYGKVFIGTFEGKFLALNQKDGKVVWEYEFGKGEADSSPVVADGKVYIGHNGGYFYSLNANTGEIVWKEKLGGPSAALASGILIVQNRMAEDNFNAKTPVIIAFSDEGKYLLD